jgi:long-subunit fatty acid transport protein
VKAAWRAISVLTGTVVTTVSVGARASSALEFPDNGVAQFSRAGAWLATASDPIAGYYNPAALSTQATGLGLGANFVFQRICYQRKGPGGTDTAPSPSLQAQNVTYPEVCNDNSGKPNVIPNLAFVWRASKDLGIGLTIVPPSAYGLIEYPDRVSVPTRSPIPAPQRYQVLSTKGTILFPTLAVGYSVTDQLHVGVGFVSGIAILESVSMSMANVDSTNPHDDFTQDTRSTVKAKDLFVPGFVGSVLYEVTENLDVAGWYRWSDKIRAKGDLEVIAPYYVQSGAVRPRCDYPGQVAKEGKNCADITRSEDIKGKDAASITLTIPMEARLGTRWHVPRAAAEGIEAEHLPNYAFRTRDPLADDLYDVEIDLTWANNGAGDNLEVRFPDGIAVNGTPGTVPTNADRPTGWKDSFGARLGGQYNLVRNRLGLRAGTWLETSATKPEYLSPNGVAAMRGGFGGGIVYRIGMVDLETGYQHIWSAGLDNGGDGASHAIAGTGSPDHRSYHAINGGKVKQHANVFSLGAVARF